MLSALLVGLLAAASAAEKCADPDVLDQRLDQLMMRLDPGISMETFKVLTSSSWVQLEPYEKIDGEEAPTTSAKRAMLMLTTPLDRGRRAGRYLDCFFDDRDALLECRPFRGRLQTQNVTDAQLDRLKEGMSPEQVRAILCGPGREVVHPNGELEWRYTYPVPAAGHSAASVTLRFDKKRRMRKPDVHYG